jgi:hypothetical protein
MSNTVHSDMYCKDDFIEGAARCFFVCAFADFVEEEEREDDGYVYASAGAGDDWYNVAPDRTPPAAYAAAGELWARLAILNKATAPCGVISLLNQAADANGTDRDEIDAEHFGRDCAMMALGTGVSWFDDNSDFPLEVPYMDCGTVTFASEAYRDDCDQ